MNYAQIKKLDEKSLKKMTEGTGPIDQCICSVLDPGASPRKGFRASIKKAFAAIGGPSRKQRDLDLGGCIVDLPLPYSKRGKGIFTTKEDVKRRSYAKCECDREDFPLKHSIGSMQVTPPDTASICRCLSDCLPRHKSLSNNSTAQVVNSHVLDVDNVDSEFSMYSEYDNESIPEPRRPCPKEDDQYSDVSEWSSGAN